MPQPDPKALILVVERDPRIKKLERFFLEQAGYRVEFAEVIPPSLPRCSRTSSSRSAAAPARRGRAEGTAASGSGSSS